MKKLALIFCLLYSSQLYASVLSDAANAMTPGTWVTLNTNGLTDAMLAPGGTNNHITQYSDSAAWDPIAKKFYFIGKAHDAGGWTFVVYDDATNTWSTIPVTPSGFIVEPAHAYDQNTFDTTNQVHYFRYPGSKTIHKYVPATGIWSQITIPMFSAQFAGALEYFPGLNALIWLDGDWGVWKWDIGASSWCQVANTNGESGGTGCFGARPKLSVGPYHNFIEYNPMHQVMWFGGGNGSNRGYRMNTSGVITTLNPAPFELGILRTLISYDPATGKYLVSAGLDDLTPDFYQYDVMTDTWTLLPSAQNPPFWNDTADVTFLATVEAPITNYGVTMYLTYRDNTGAVDSKVRLYKHGTPPADTTNPSVPGSLSANTTSSSNIDLSWAASTDNVAVAGYRVERCTGTGCSSYAEISQPTGTSYSNSGVAASTTIYRYRVRAVDTSTNFSGYSTPVESTLFTGGGTGNFTTRCAASGVVRCFGFDVTGDFNTGVGSFNGAWGQNYGIFPPYSTEDYTRATRDTSIKASGASSLRFRIPTNSPADTSGSWFTNFSTDLNTRFGPGETFYVQWRQRFDPSFITTNYVGSAGFKQVILGTGDRAGVCNPAFPTSATCPTSCSELEIVTTSKEKVIDASTSANIVVGYHSCSFFEGFEYFDVAQGQVVTQNGPNPDCLHPAFNIPPCVSYTANEWMTFKMRVSIGTWNVADSTVQIWAAREGQPTSLVIDFRPAVGHGVVLHNSNPTTDEYGKLWLLPYQTGKDNTQAHAETYTWFDELIISTQDIADPSEVEGGVSLVPTISQKRRRK